jgi:hypothetical protein
MRPRRSERAVHHDRGGASDDAKGDRASGAAVAVGRFNVVHHAHDETNVPREGRLACEQRRRPIVGRLDVGKGMASRQGGPWCYGRINQARQFVHRREPPLFASAGGEARAVESCTGPTLRLRLWRLFPHESRLIVAHGRTAKVRQDGKA